MRRLAPGEFLKDRHIASHESFLFRATPFLELAFRFDCVGEALEPLREEESDWPARFGIPFECSVIVLRDPCLELCARYSDV